MASPPKRPKIPEDLILTVAKEASDTEIPWANVAPPFLLNGSRNYWKIYSKNERSFHEVKLHNSTYLVKLTRPPPT